MSKLSVDDFLVKRNSELKGLKEFYFSLEDFRDFQANSELIDGFYSEFDNGDELDFSIYKFRDEIIKVSEFTKQSESEGTLNYISYYKEIK